jgi:hypothetical protein
MWMQGLLYSHISVSQAHGVYGRPVTLNLVGGGWRLVDDAILRQDTHVGKWSADD